MNEAKFNPKDYMVNLKGKMYLPVAARLIWFRELNPSWTIETEWCAGTEKIALFKAFIKDDKGRTIATAHKFSNKIGDTNEGEKCETGAIGRALAMCGFGTQFTDDFEEGESLADAPRERRMSPDEKVQREASGRVGFPPHGRQGLVNQVSTTKASEKQINMISYQFKRLGTSPEGRLNFLNGKAINELTVSEASNLIKKLVDIPDLPEDEPSIPF